MSAGRGRALPCHSFGRLSSTQRTGGSPAWPEATHPRRATRVPFFRPASLVARRSATPLTKVPSPRAAVPLGHDDARSARAPSTVGRKRTGEGARREATKWRDRDTIDLHSRRDMARPVRGGQPEENDGDGKRERVRRLPTLRLVTAGNCGEASQDGGSRRPGTASPSRTVKVRPGTQHAPPVSQDASRRRTQPGGPELASSHPDHPYTVPRRHHRPRKDAPERPRTLEASRDALHRPWTISSVADAGRGGLRRPCRPGTPPPVLGCAHRPRTHHRRPTLIDATLASTLTSTTLTSTTLPTSTARAHPATTLTAMRFAVRGSIGGRCGLLATVVFIGVI